MSAVSSIAGGLVSGVGSLIGAHQQNSAAAAQQVQAEQYNTASMTQAENYDTQMADTTFQRTEADLRAAGLNPMLAVGSQNPSPTISAPTVSQAPVQNELGSAMNAAISNYSALQGARQQEAAVDATKADTNLKNANTTLAAAQTATALEQAKKLQSGALSSDVLGTTLAGKGSQLLNSAVDNVSQKVSSIVSGIKSNSASALDAHISTANEYLNHWKDIKNFFTGGSSQAPSGVGPDDADTIFNGPAGAPY